jgi:hypothetical protein
MKMKPKKRVKHDLLVVYIDLNTGLEGSVVYESVSEYQLHRLRNEATNIKSIHKLQRREQ